MKASELVRRIQEAIQEHGDLDVKVWPYDGREKPCDCQDVAVRAGVIVVED